MTRSPRLPSWLERLQDADFAGTVAPEGAAEALARWSEALGGPDRLRRRLARAGVSPDPLAAVEASRRGPADAERPFEIFDPHAGPRTGANVARAPFPELIEPIVAEATARLLARLPPDGTDERRPLPEGLADGLRGRLAALAAPSLYAAFCDFRGAGPSLLASLGLDPGPRSRGVYGDFVARERAARLAPCLAAFPELRRLLHVGVESWMAACAQLLDRASRDHQRIAETFALDPLASLVAVRMDLGDPHRRGQSVCRLTYAAPGGAETLVIYKPRPMQIDQAFARLLAWLGADDPEPPLRAPAVLTGDGYGFCEHIAWEPVVGPDGLERFYRDAGRLLAILFVLGTEDVHHENVIVDGERLVLVDAETLLNGELASAPPSAALAIAHSVLRTGLLPAWRIHAVGDRVVAVDPTGLGHEPPGSGMITPQWRALGKDGLTWGPGPAAAAAAAAYPLAGPRPGLALGYARTVAKGFRSQIQSLADRRHELLAPDGPIAAFAGLAGRIVLRPTHLYAAVQETALEPEALADPFERGMRLEVLARSRLDDQTPGAWTVFESELEQLDSLDIPVFEQRTDALDIRAPEGPPIMGVLRRSGLDCCRERLARLTPEEIDLQARLIEGAFDARAARHGQEADPAAPAASPAPEGLARLVVRLARAAVGEAGQAPEWLGLEIAPDGERFSFGVVGPSLYGGQAGIALAIGAALAQPALVEALPTWEAELLAERFAGMDRRLLDLLQVGEDASTRVRLDHLPLGLAGLGGLLLYAWIRRRRQGATATAAPGAALECARRALARGATASVIAGAAGLIGPLLRLASLSAAEEAESLEALAGACADAICEAQAADGGWSEPGAPRPLAGFSHGAAGIVAALAAVYAHSGDGRHREAGLRGLAFERRLYDPGRRNWPDLRTPAQPPPFAVSWCHGAPGIALGRFCLQGGPLWDLTAAEALSAALETCAAHLYRDMSLCCGAAGAAAILALAERRRQADAPTKWERRIAELRRQALAAPPPEARFPGLFNGMAGACLTGLGEGGLDIVADALSAGLLPVSPSSDAWRPRSPP